jgi:hypothetical protein
MANLICLVLPVARARARARVRVRARVRAPLIFTLLSLLTPTAGGWPPTLPPKPPTTLSSQLPHPRRGLSQKRPCALLMLPPLLPAAGGRTPMLLLLPPLLLLAIHSQPI